MIQWSIPSSLLSLYWYPGEVPLTTEWAWELVESHSGLLLLRLTGESGKGSHPSFRPKTGGWTALPEKFIRKGSNLGDRASDDTPKAIQDGIMDDTNHCVVPPQVALVPHSNESHCGCIAVELEIAGVVDPTWTFTGRLISRVGVDRIWPNDAADEIFVFGAGLCAVFEFSADLVAVYNLQAWLRGACVRVVVALRVTLLCKHEMTRCIIWKSSSFLLASGLSPMRSREFSACILQMSDNSY